jgi:ABC-type multidrug transport system fused ATPase/permease subunit
MRLAFELWGLLTRSQRRTVLAAQAISLIMAFSTVTGIAAIAPFFAVLGNGALAERQPMLHWLYVHGGFSSKQTFVLALGGAFIVMVAVANTVGAIGSWAMNHIALRIGDELKRALFEEYLARPYLFHVRTHSAEVFDKVVYETTRVADGILQSAFMLVTNFFTAVLIVAAVLLVRPALSMVMLLGLGGGYLAMYVLVRKRLLHAGQEHSRSWTAQTKIANEAFGAIREVLLLRDKSLFCGDFARASRGVAETAARVHVISQTPRYLMECLAVGALVAVAVVLDAQSPGKGEWLGELTFVAFAAYRLMPMLQQVFVAVVRIRANRPSLALIAPDLRLRRAAAGRPSPPPGIGASDGWRDGPRHGIQLRHVSFRYETDKPWALEDICLELAPRSLIGLVGANGSGKTTLLDIVAGLISPEKGEVLIDGVDLRDDNRAAWQAKIAYVPQSVFLIDGSIGGNIAFGVSRDDIDQERVALAARLAGLAEFIAGLPQGYAQRVGERGIEMSGGRRQLIGIARALYRDAPVLLLDEPTSALDGSSEAALADTLRGLAERCTVVIASHRLGVLRASDVVHHFERGRICASGTCGELLGTSESFRRVSGATATA